VIENEYKGIKETYEKVEKQFFAAKTNFLT